MQVSSVQEAARSSNRTRWVTKFKRAGDTTIDSVTIDRLTAVVKEVAEVWDHAPLVKTITGVILQIIKIRNEIKDNRERCLEIIDKVLSLSKLICDRLASIAKSGDRVKENLAQMERLLEECESTLDKVLKELEKYQSRNRFLKFLNHGFADLEKHGRSVEELHNKLRLNISVDIKHELERPVSSQNSTKFLPSSSGREHILPEKPELMVERESDLDAALNILLNAEPSRIAILGGGGFGKTTLAQWILHDPKIIERYTRLYFLSCEGVHDVGTLLASLGTMLNMNNVAPPKMLTSIRYLLETSSTLLCLDNFETPWEPSATRTKIEEVLGSIADIPGLSLIVTMRGNQRPSQVVWSKPLLKPLSTLSLDGAKLILQNIAGDQPESDVTDQLLQAINGIPLAITLMSMLLQDGESVESLWTRWSKNHTQIIHAGVRDPQSSLNASISLSIESGRMKSNPDAMKLLAALSSFSYGFSPYATVLENLQRNLGLDDIHTALETLRIVGLIKVDRTDTPRRIQILSPIRLYCHEFLSSEISLALEEVVDYYADIMTRSIDLKNQEAYTLIVPDIPNIHSAFQKGYIAGCSEKSNFKLVAATLVLHEWSRYIGLYAKETIQIALDRSPDLPYLQTALLLMSLASIYRFEIDKEREEQLYKEAGALFRQHGNYAGEASTLAELGNMLSDEDRHNEAAVVLEASLELYRTKVPDDLHGQSSVLARLGECNMANGQLQKAQEYFKNAAEAYITIGDLLGQSSVAWYLSKLQAHFGNLVEAEELATASLDAAKSAKFRFGEGNALLQRGTLYFLTGRLTEARRDLEQGVPIIKQHGPPVVWLHAVNALGLLYIRLDDLTAAEALLTASIKVKLDSIWIAHILTTIGWLYICGDRPDKAEPRAQEALELCGKFKDKHAQAFPLIQLARVYLKTDRLEDAVRVLTSIPDSMGVWPDVEIWRLWVLGDLYIIQGNLEEAESSLNSAMDSIKSEKETLYQHGNIHRSMGTLHVKRGRVDSAIANFMEALELHRKSQWTSEQATDLQRLGEAYQMLGRINEADEAFNEAKALMETVHEAMALP